jgi:hypothetical protein
MERQEGFDPMASMAKEVVDFMENIEAVKEKESPFEKVKSKKKDTKKKTDTLSPPKKNKFYCSHHGPNSSHETKDCLVIKNKVGNKSSGGKKSTNKMWVRKAVEANSASKKELAAVVEKWAKKGVKKQLAAVSSKNARSPTLTMNQRTRIASSSRNSPRASMVSTTMTWRNSPLAMTRSAFES